MEHANVHVLRDRAHQTRDGTRLLADVYLPDGDGPFPTLLYRIRGSKDSSFINGTLMFNPVVAATHGYAVVVQNVRGRGASEGDWHPFVHETDDGLDALGWVRSQEWCNGRIGAYGSAYAGSCALLLAAAAPPELEAIVTMVTGADLHDGWIYTQGAFELGWNVFWAHLTAGETLARAAARGEHVAPRQAALSAALRDPKPEVDRMPLRERPVLDGVSDHYFTWLDHPQRDEYWTSLDVVAKAGRITAAVLSITGWWDNFLDSHLQLYRALRDRSPRGADQRLVIGPWDHFSYVAISPSAAGDRIFGPDAVAGASTVTPMALAWFDRWLRADEGAASPGVRWFLPGPDAWREEPSWPPEHTPTRWYLHSMGSATTSSGDGMLTLDPPADEPPDRFRYDPADPVPSVGGNTLMPPLADSGVRDQAGVSAREDVLCFTSPVLAEDLAIAGSVVCELWATTTAVDTDFTAKLVDVAPDGYCAFVADGIVRLRSVPDLAVTPGEPMALEIELWDRAWTFIAGHRVRLEISSSNYPRFDRNLNTAVPFDRATLDDAVVARQTVWHDAARPSALVLPVMGS